MTRRGTTVTSWTVAAAVPVVLVGALVVGVRLDVRNAPVLRDGAAGLLVAAPAADADQPSVARPGPGSGSDPRTGPVVSPQWVRTTAATSGVPEPAVRAYGTATLREADAAPACHLSWTTLAGIGWVESAQGTIGGRHLRPDGRPNRRIAGPDLDGRGDVAAVPGEQGAWQHAVGPLQFLPSTWRRWASDGDGDGVRDPDDIDDAAYAAARYLCASGGDLATGPGWSVAVFSYNHSDDYVRAVYDAASAYAVRTGS